MALTDYTSCDDVRAALGVSDDEIDDATLSLPLYEFNLTIELADLGASLKADILAAKAIVTAGSAPETTEAFYQAAFLFCTYAVAHQATVSLPMFSPQEITDGQAAVSRYRQDPYKATIAKVDGQYSRFKSVLISTYGTYKATGSNAPTVRTFIAGIPPSYDPITG